MPNYRINLYYRADRSRFVAVVPELERCEAEGATRAEALVAVEKEVAARLDTMAREGVQPPEAIDSLDQPQSVTLSLSAPLYRDLALFAKEAGVGLEPFLVECLARLAGAQYASVGPTGRGAKRGERPPRDGDHQGRRREGRVPRDHGESGRLYRVCAGIAAGREPPPPAPPPKVA